ncbi:MAG: isochorismatase family protein [Clostridiales Family XIII bacterium]|jgi:nicotinamidase-related amidase|nr:isochorismatase family protein [Clostridiales Family XIII bacterium]
MMKPKDTDTVLSAAKAQFQVRAEDTVLVVIDLQERLVPAMHDAYSLTRYADMLIQGCTELGLPAIFTQQYTKGLGETIPQIRDGYMSASLAAAGNVKLAGEDPIISARDDAEFSYIEKTSFSAMGEPAFAEALARTGQRSAIICGIEAHVCVMQSALDMISHGYGVWIAADATASRHERDAALAYSRMAQCGAAVTTVEALLFELMGGARHPSFRQISALVK